MEKVYGNQKAWPEAGNPNLDKDRNTDTTPARNVKLIKDEEFQLMVWGEINTLV